MSLAITVDGGPPSAAFLHYKYFDCRADFNTIKFILAIYDEVYQNEQTKSTFVLLTKSIDDDLREKACFNELKITKLERKDNISSFFAQFFTLP